MARLEDGSAAAASRRARKPAFCRGHRRIRPSGDGIGEQGMPDVSWNSSVWDGHYDWAGGGEEWSATWGGSEAQWFGALLPRLHRALPARAIIEIAPGFGRWTRFLLPACKNFVGIDLSAQCIEACRSRFRGARHAEFVQNDGLSLAEAPDGRFDLVFSFDSLVHAEIEVLQAYVPQIVRKLRGRGVAFIHHSNLAALADGTPNPHRRAGSVSAEVVAKLVRGCGGAVLIQEIVNWGGADLHDCFSLFGLATAYEAARPALVQNPRFMEEASIVGAAQSPWSAIPLSGPPPAPGDASRRTRMLDRLRQALSWT
jgi:2-polyprenyl-3-methyl-5-hydroxy-6-metoxy-1,4-benzoquinol methylase